MQCIDCCITSLSSKPHIYNQFLYHLIIFNISEQQLAILKVMDSDYLMSALSCISRTESPLLLWFKHPFNAQDWWPGILCDKTQLKQRELLNNEDLFGLMNRVSLFDCENKLMKGFWRFLHWEEGWNIKVSYNFRLKKFTPLLSVMMKMMSMVVLVMQLFYFF